MVERAGRERPAAEQRDLDGARGAPAVAAAEPGVEAAGPPQQLGGFEAEEAPGDSTAPRVIDRGRPA